MVRVPVPFCVPQWSGFLLNRGNVLVNLRGLDGKGLPPMLCFGAVERKLLQAVVVGELN
jgi:hypothetical protein